MLLFLEKNRDFCRCPTGVTPNCPVHSVNSGIPGAPILRHVSQSPSREVQVGQRAQHEQSMSVLIQPSVANLGESEDTLDHGKDIFHLRAHFRFGQVARLGRIIQWRVATAFLMGEVLCAGRRTTYRLSLSAISRIAPHPRFITMQQVFEQLRIVDIRRSGRYRVDLPGLAVDADVRLQSGKDAVLPPHPPLRTVHESHPSYGSSLSHGLERTGRHDRSNCACTPSKVLVPYGVKRVGLVPYLDMSHDRNTHRFKQGKVSGVTRDLLVRSEYPIPASQDPEVTILDPASGFHGVSARRPCPQEFPNLMIKPREAGFCHNVPMVHRPSPDEGVEGSDQVGLRRTDVGLDQCANLSKKGRYILLGRRNQQLARILSNNLAEEVKTRRDMRDLGFLFREFQASLGHEFPDRRENSLLQDRLRGLGHNKVVGIPDDVDLERSPTGLRGCQARMNSVGQTVQNHVRKRWREHAPYAKDNFQFERRIEGWRKLSLLDLRRK